jgi:hypothetical protein
MLKSSYIFNSIIPPIQTSYYMSLRPVNPPKITKKDLLPGDVLLSAGSSILDKLIILIDRGDYSHATQYMGYINGDYMVVEATRGGIKYESIDVDVDAQDLIDVYRFNSLDGHHFEDPGWPVKPVLDQAMTYVNAKYAYSELILGAVVILASEFPAGRWKPFLREALSELEHKFVTWLDKNKDKTPMTCVQVVTSAHWQAPSIPDNKYALQVTLSSTRKPLVSDPSNLEHYHGVRERLISAVDSVHPGFSQAVINSKANSSITVAAGSDLLPLGSCTPTDLQTSPTLKFVGCLKGSKKK